MAGSPGPWPAGSAKPTAHTGGTDCPELLLHGAGEKCEVERVGKQRFCVTIEPVRRVLEKQGREKYAGLREFCCRIKQKQP